MPPGQGNFPELGSEDASGPATTATIRNFRPPTGVHNMGSAARTTAGTLPFCRTSDSCQLLLLLFCGSSGSR